jgi:hypothetical protein
MRRSCVVVAIVMATVISTQAQEFKADVERTVKGGLEKGSIWVKGGKSMTDLGPPRMGMMGADESAEQPKVNIVTDKDTGTMTVINLTDKTYSVMQVGAMSDPEAMGKMVVQMGGSITESGTEKIGGLKCTKVIYSYPMEAMGKMIVWKATGLKDYIVKMDMTSPFMSIKMELKNIKKTKIPDSKFEVPKGFKKIDTGMGGMR